MARSVPKGFAALDAVEGLGLVQHTQRLARLAAVRQPQARLELQRVFGAGLDAQPALHAVLLDEAQLRPVGVVGQRAGRAGAHARQAQRALLRVDHQAAPGRARRRQRQRLGQPAGQRRHRQQMVERQLQRAAFLGLRHGLGRAGHAHRRRSAQRQVQRRQVARVAHVDRAQMRAAETQAGHQRLAHRHLLGQCRAVLGRLFVGHQHPDLAGALRQRHQPQVQADAGGVPHGHRQHPRRQAVHASVGAGGAAQRVDQALARAFAVDQQGRVLATGAPIAGQQRAHAPTLVLRAGRRETQCAAGAHGGAGTAAHAQVGVDDDAAALAARVGHGRRGAMRLGAGLALERGVAADGTRRAHVDAGRAADLLVAAVRAQRLLVAEEARLLELTHQVAQLQHGLHQAALVASDMEVALRRRVLGEGRGVAQVEHQVEVFAHRLRGAIEVDRAGGFAHAHAVAVLLAGGQVDAVAEVDRAFGAGGDAGIAACAQLQVDRVAG